MKEKAMLNKNDNITLTTGFLYLIVTTICTLKCKDCTIAIPMHKSKHTDKNEIFSMLHEVFEIYDYVDRLIIQGGEAFLHPDIAEIIEETAKYSNKFGHMMFITNGTFIPGNAVLETIKKLPCKCLVRIDDYGVYSKKVKEVLAMFENNGITIEVRNYNAEAQYFGGWVDVLGGYKFHRYSDEELRQVFERCLNRDNCKFAWGGKLWGCGMHGSGVLLGKVPDNPNDSVDLLNDDDIANKRKIARNMGHRPYEGCKYCNGFDPENSPRISAAEQITD
jgi:hypothetical protein